MAFNDVLWFTHPLIRATANKLVLNAHLKQHTEKTRYSFDFIPFIYCLDCFTLCIFIAVTKNIYIHPCVHQINFFAGVIKLNLKVHLQRFGRCLEHPCSHVGNFAAPLKMFVSWSAWGHTNGSCWGKCKHYSFAFPIRNFPAGLWIKTTDLLITSAACLTSLQLHCLCSLSLNQDCPAAVLIAQEATSFIVFIATFSCLPQKHCSLKSKFTLQLVQWFSRYLHIEKHIFISSSNWQYPNVTWRVTYLRRKYLFISLFINEFKAEFHLLAH